MENDKAKINKIKKKFVDRLIVNFLDIIILAHFRDKLFSGYDIILFINREFGTLISSGTVYSHIYSMERQKLAEDVTENDRKRLYRITEKGKLTLNVVTSNMEISEFMKRIFK